MFVTQQPRRDIHWITAHNHTYASAKKDNNDGCDAAATDDGCDDNNNDNFKLNTGMSFNGR